MDDFETYIRSQQQISNAALTAPEQPKPVSMEDDFSQFVKDSQQADAQAAVVSNASANPDNSAKAAQVAKQIGLPQTAVETDLPRYQQQAEIQKNSQILSSNPVLASWVAANPESARIAQDDFDKLGVIDKTWKDISSGYQQGLLSNKLGRLGITKQLSGATGVEVPNTDIEIQQTESALQAIPQLSGIHGFIQGFSNFAGAILDNAARSAAAGAVIGGGLGSLAGGVGALPGAAAGATIGATRGAVLDMMAVAGGRQYLNLNMMRDASGAPLSETAKQAGTLAVMAAVGVLGTYGTVLTKKIVGETAESLATKAFNEVLQRPTFRNALAKFGKSSAFDLGIGGAINTGMEASNIIGEEIAKAISPGDFKSDPQEIVSRLADAFVGGVETLGVMHTAMHGIGLYGDIQNASRAESQMQAFKNIMDGAVKSKTRDRSMDAFQSFMQHQTEGTPQEHLFIPAETVRRFYQSAGIDPALEDRTQDPLFGFVQDMPKQLEEAAKTGGDVVIPTADYITHLAGSEVSEKLLPDIRLGANSMNLNEAKAYQAEYETRVKVALEEAAKEKSAEPTSHQQLFQEIKDQILNAGRSNAEAVQGAAIEASRYMRRAEALGIDPLQLYKESVEIQKGDAADVNKFMQSDNQEFYSEKYPFAGEIVDGRVVRDHVPNMASIEATFDDYDILSGIREFPVDAFPGASAKDMFYSKSDIDRTHSLAEQINESGEINPLIVVLDKNGPYILEGGHRLAALHMLGAKSFPAKIVIDLDNPPSDNVKDRTFYQKEIKNPFLSFLGRTGVALEHKEDITGEKGKAGNRLIPGGTLFRKNGLNLDKLALSAQENGFLSEADINSPTDNGGINKLSDMIRRAQAGEKIYPIGEFDTERLNLEEPTLSEEELEREALSGYLDINDMSEDLPFSEDGGTIHPRGAIDFKGSKAIISLFDSSDPSTLIHELGHSWLEELKADAERSDAPEQLKNDWEITKQYLKNNGEEITEDQHEQFARTAEAYVMEGKAPSNELAAAFRRFKTWLTKLYGIISNLRTPINDEIRGVFDRLLATDEEIANVKASQGLEAAFKSKEDAGMTSAEWKAYNKAIDTANHQAESTLLEKMMKKVRRQRTAEYKQELSAAKEEAKNKVDQRADIQALRLVTKGLMPDGSKFEGTFKLNRAVTERLYGKDGLKDLPKGSLSKDSGLYPQDLAEILGYRSGDDVIQALKSLEMQQREIQVQEGERRGIRQYLIDQEAERHIDEKHGDILDEESMRDEALAAVHSEQQVKLLALELHYLNRLGAQALVERGQGRLDVKQANYEARWKEAEADLVHQLEMAKQENQSDQVIEKLKQKIADLKMTERWYDAERNTNDANLKQAVKITSDMVKNIQEYAENLIFDKSLDDINGYRKYADFERKAAREVQNALLRKDPAAAAQAKQRQIFNMILFDKMRKASERIDKGRRMMKQLASKDVHENIDQDYTNQIHDLLGRFGFDSGRGEELQRVMDNNSLKDFVASLYVDYGQEVAVDPILFDHPLTPFNTLTYEEFNTLDMAIRSLRELGRMEKKIIINGEEEEFNDLLGRVVDAILSDGKRKESKYLNPKAAPLTTRFKEALFHFARSTDALNLKTESLVDDVDDRDPFGIMNTAVFRPLKDADNNRKVWSEKTAKGLKALADTMPKNWLKELTDYVPNQSLRGAPDYNNPNAPRDLKILSRKEVLSIALNWGNKGNRARLLKGHDWDEGTVKDFLDTTMRKDDWAFVTGVWDLFKEYQEPLDQLQREVTGIGLDMVQPDPFDTPHGRMEGGYFPIVEDKTKSGRAKKYNEKASAESLFQDNYGRATKTPQSHTISRIGGDRPILIDLDIVPWKIGQVIHDIAMRKAIMKAHKILSHPLVEKALDDVYGEEYRKLLYPWLQGIANSRNIDDASVTFWNRFCSAVRTNAVIAGVGFRIGTIEKHTLSALAGSIHEIGGEWLLKGSLEFYGQGMTKNWEFIKSKDPEMAFRLTTLDQDTQQQYANLFKDGTYTKLKQQLQHFSTATISYLDLGSAAPTWLGAYRKGLAPESEGGLGLSDADAVYFAGKTVRNAHGSQGLLDRAAVQELKGFGSLFNMFLGFMNHVYNRQRLIVQDAASGIRNVRAGEYREASGDFGRVLARSWWYVAMTGMIDAYVTHSGPDEDKDETWAGWAAKAIATGATSGIFGLRDIAKAAFEGHKYESSPIEHMVNTAIDAGKDAYKTFFTEEEPKNATKHVVEAAGYGLGLPVSAPFAAGKFLWDYSNGDVDPQSLAEWIQGLKTGKTSE